MSDASPDRESFPNNDELKELFTASHDWLLKHGESTSANGFVGYAPDENIIADSGVNYTVNLRVCRLWERFPQVMVSLGIVGSLEVVAYESFYPAHRPGAEQWAIDDGLERAAIMFKHDTPAYSPYKSVARFIEAPRDPNDRQGEYSTDTSWSPHIPPHTAAEIIDVVNSLNGARKLGLNRMTSTEYRALEKIMRACIQYWPEISE